MNFGFVPELNYNFVCEDRAHENSLSIRADWRGYRSENPFRIGWICNDCKARYDAMTEDDVTLWRITRKLEQS